MTIGGRTWRLSASIVWMLTCGCHVPSTFTSARPVAPGKLTVGLGIEPIQDYTYEKREPGDLPPFGPNGATNARNEALRRFLVEGSGAPRSSELRGGMPLLLARYGVHQGCDVGARLSVGIVAADYKCIWYERGPVTVSGAPQLGYVYTVGSDTYSGDGVILSTPVLVSADVTSWFRVTVSPGVSFAAGRVYLLSNDSIPWPNFGGEAPLRRSSPVLDGMYARAGFALEVHSSFFSVQPEVTFVQGVATLEPVRSLHTGLAFTFGAVP